MKEKHGGNNLTEIELAEQEREKGMAALFVFVGLICLIMFFTENIWISVGIPTLFSGGFQIYSITKKEKEK